MWLGTTDASGAFAALTPDETLGVVHGPQGGTHVWGAARLYAPQDGTWTLRFALKDAGGAELAAVAEVVEACAGGVVEETYVTVFLHVSAPTAGVLSVDATPSGASTAAAHAEVSIKVQ